MTNSNDVGPDQFICEMCGGIFPKAWSDEVARDEAIAKGIDPDEPCGSVCDDCYKLTPWGMDQSANCRMVPSGQTLNGFPVVRTDAVPEVDIRDVEFMVPGSDPSDYRRTLEELDTRERARLLRTPQWPEADDTNVGERS